MIECDCWLYLWRELVQRVYILITVELYPVEGGSIIHNTGRLV